MRAALITCVLLLPAACSDTGTDRGPDALSTALEPAQPAAHYVAQANAYFDTLDTSADRQSIPSYAVLVARWEWPPWLKLTGIGREQIHALDEGVRAATPSTVPQRDCRFFERQPFARCHVLFDYPDQGQCPIYEEFTFNDDGEMTFVEAWSEQPGMLPTTDDTDHWAEGTGVHRLSTRIPGLGNSQGLIDLEADWMEAAAEQDAEVADFLARARSFASYWLQEYAAAGNDLFERGCGWK